MEHEEAAANRAVPITGLIDINDALRLRALPALEPAHAQPPGSLDVEARLAVEGERLLGLFILDPRTGGMVVL